ncbi:MAG: ribosome maturation protein RimP [Erythrobacter sp.]|jgi:ribosome maturation factor RimP|nr:ribosome maturation protein RimP [Erythrobacter sp.]
MTDIARLTALIEPEAQALGFDLVRVAMMPSEAGDGGQALQIMAEDPATGQLVIDQCAALSRRVSDMIDAHEEAGVVLIEGAYHLEVSSPGIDRPLTRDKDFANWAGHEARIVMVKDYARDSGAQRVHKGELHGIEDGMVLITDAKAGLTRLPRAEIHSAKLVLTDALIAATRPIDTKGAEELIEDTEEEKADD